VILPEARVRTRGITWSIDHIVQRQARRTLGVLFIRDNFFFRVYVVWWTYITDTIIPRCCPDLPRIVETLRDSTALLEGEEQPSKGMVYSSRLLHGAAVCREVDDVLTAMVSSVTTCQRANVTVHCFLSTAILFSNPVQQSCSAILFSNPICPIYSNSWYIWTD
jgi:hypothetical protein